MDAGSCMSGKTVLITGATSGVGRAAAKQLAELGADLFLTGRSEERLAASIAGARGAGRAEGVTADLSTMEGTKRLAAEFRRSHDRLDVLILNAGMMFGDRLETGDGFEMTFALDHLSPFLLAHELADMLIASAPSRVVVTSSVGHRFGRMRFDDLMRAERYSAFGSYCQAKLANAMFAIELAERLEGTGVTSNCLHPGLVRTGFARGVGGWFEAAWKLMRPLTIGPERAAEVVTRLASDPALERETGGYYTAKGRKRPSRAARDPERRHRLWEASSRLVGVDPGRDFVRQFI